MKIYAYLKNQCFFCTSTFTIYINQCVSITTTLSLFCRINNAASSSRLQCLRFLSAARTSAKIPERGFRGGMQPRICRSILLLHVLLLSFCLLLFSRPFFLYPSPRCFFTLNVFSFFTFSERAISFLFAQRSRCASSSVPLGRRLTASGRVKKKETDGRSNERLRR